MVRCSSSVLPELQKRTGQGQILRSCWSGSASATVWGCDLLWWWLSLLAQLLQKMFLPLQHLSYLVWTWSHVLRWLFSFSYHSLEILCPESCSRAVRKLFTFHVLVLSPAKMYLCTQFSTIPIFPFHLSSEKNRRMAEGSKQRDGLFSAKLLLNIPGKLISSHPRSAIATSIFPKASCLLYLPVAKLVSVRCF